MMLAMLSCTNNYRNQSGYFGRLYAPRWSVLFLQSLLVVAACSPGLAAANDSDKDGEAIYRFYCYQCHGYAGDANTLAATYMSPAPRNFAGLAPEALPEGQIVEAVLKGRPGTAMVSFSSVLDKQDAQAVASYIRSTLLGNSASDARYHSPENGWPDHDRYEEAYPFVDGSIGLDTRWEALSASERRGRRLYESACVSCHDQPVAGADDALAWELRAVSYPRKHFSHRLAEHDLVSGASPYRRHDVAPDASRLTTSALAGKVIYEENCAFCHAIDGTGQNWIGSFLEPRPRDFTDAAFTLLGDTAALEERILYGIQGTSMPAWRDVLSPDQVATVVAYIQQAFGPETTKGEP